MNGEKSTILVTGASGLIGSALARRLADTYRVIGFDIKDGGSLPAGAEFFEVDLTRDDSVGRGLRQVRDRHGPELASVIHLAAYYDFSGEPSPLYDELTVEGTRRLLRALRELSVGQFVFSSTMLVHAPCEPGQRIDEDWPIQPKWDYPRSKAETEKVIRAEHGKVPAVNLRIAGVYDDLCHSIPIANQIQRIYEKRLTGMVYPGDTDKGQAFLHLDDLLDAFQRVIELRSQLPAELTLLLGEPETVSYGELQNELGRLIHGKEWDTLWIPKPVAKAGAWVQDKLPGEDPFIKPWMVDLADDHYALDIRRAQKHLGWQPRRTLRETLPVMVAALRADPERWYRENGLEPTGAMKEGAAPERR